MAMPAATGTRIDEAGWAKTLAGSVREGMYVVIARSRVSSDITIGRIGSNLYCGGYAELLRKILALLVAQWEL